MFKPIKKTIEKPYIHPLENQSRKSKRGEEKINKETIKTEGLEA